MTAQLALTFVDGQAPAVSAVNLNAIVDAINTALAAGVGGGAGTFVEDPPNSGFGVITGGVGTTTTDASLLTSGTLDDARLPVASQAVTLRTTYRMRAQDWFPGYDFIVGESIIQAGVLYRCSTAHKSVGWFDATKFTAVGGSGGTPTTDATLLTTGTLSDARLPLASNAAAVGAKAALVSPAFTGAPTVNGVPIGAGSAATTDSIWVDDMAGANDDAKFQAALNYAASVQYPPTIRFKNRRYELAVGGHVPFSGLSIWGQECFNNPERSVPTGSQLHLTCNGGWFVAPSSIVYTTAFGNLSFVGGSNASVMTMGTPGQGGMFCFNMHNISSTGLSSVLGTQASAFIIDAAQFDGANWEINNCYNGAFHLSGSDNVLWPQGMLLDSGTGYYGSGQYHLWLDSCEKTMVGPLYITCEADWGGVKVSGPGYRDGSAHGNGGTVWITGARIEGRNDTKPSWGSNVRVEGGQLTLRDCWIAYGMSNPTNGTLGHSPVDGGVIHQTAGRVKVDNCTYDRTNGQPETVPFLYSGGGVARVRDVSTAQRSMTWSGLPRVQAAGGSVVIDDTATLI